MTQTVFLVYKSQPQVGAQVYNGVLTVVVNSDTGANAILNAALACNAALVPTENQSEAENSPALDVYGPKYFDTAVAVSAAGGFPVSGNLSLNGDAYVMQERAAPQFIAGTAYSPVS